MDFSLPMLFPCLAAVANALYQITTRLLHRADLPVTTLFYTALVGLILVRILQDETMRQASWGSRKRRRAADRREPRGIEGGLAARAIDRLMGEIAHFIDEEAIQHSSREIVPIEH
jgi:hypothetical protein